MDAVEGMDTMFINIPPPHGGIEDQAGRPSRNSYNGCYPDGDQFPQHAGIEYLLCCLIITLITLGEAHHHFVPYRSARHDRTAATLSCATGFSKARRPQPGAGPKLLDGDDYHSDDDRIESQLHEHRTIIGIDRLRWKTIDHGKIHGFGHRTLDTAPTLTSVTPRQPSYVRGDDSRANDSNASICSSLPGKESWCYLYQRGIPPQHAGETFESRFVAPRYGGRSLSGKSGTTNRPEQFDICSIDMGSRWHHTIKRAVNALI